MPGRKRVPVVVKNGGRSASSRKPASKSKRQSKQPSPIAKVFSQLQNEIEQQVNIDNSDFAIPEEMVIFELSGPYKELASNNYRGKRHARRGLDNEDDKPLCACTSDCAPDKCQNRLMMM